MDGISTGGMRDFDTFDENLQYVVEVKNENLDEEGYATLIINLIQKGSEKKSIGKFYGFCIIFTHVISH